MHKFALIFQNAVKRSRIDGLYKTGVSAPQVQDIKNVLLAIFLLA